MPATWIDVRSLRPLGPTTEELRTVARYRSEMPDGRSGVQPSRNEIGQLRAEGASRAYISERSSEIEDRARQDYAERRDLAETVPDVAAFPAQGRDRGCNADVRGQQHLVAQIDKSLTPDAVAALRAGTLRFDKFTEQPLRWGWNSPRPTSRAVR